VTLLAPFDVSTQPPTPRRWRLADEARSYVIEVQEQRPDLEATFACGVDPVNRIITTACFCAWGTSTEGFVLRDDFSYGTMMLHTHPGPKYREAAGSAADLRCAMQLAERGIGFAVINSDGIGLLVMREPRPLREVKATGKVRTWSWGPYTLIRHS
jgi:hypothetical protein